VSRQRGSALFAFGLGLDQSVIGDEVRKLWLGLGGGCLRLAPAPNGGDVGAQEA